MRSACLSPCRENNLRSQCLQDTDCLWGGVDLFFVVFQYRQATIPARVEGILPDFGLDVRALPGGEEDGGGGEREVYSMPTRTFIGGIKVLVNDLNQAMGGEDTQVATSLDQFPIQ